MSAQAQWRVGTLATIVLLLSGCAPITPSAYTELSREQSDDDLLPLGIEQGKDIGDGSSRYVGEYDGAKFYLATATSAGGNDQVCILVWADDVRFREGVGCGMQEFHRNWPGFGIARYSPTPFPASAVRDGWQRISDNVIFEPAGATM
jgi:hypothetical protein